VEAAVAAAGEARTHRGDSERPASAFNLLAAGVVVELPALSKNSTVCTTTSGDSKVRLT
jgi:hypothetical protein